VRSFSHWLLSLFVSPTGVVVLAALDSTTFFWLPLGIDAVVVVLAARRGLNAWLVPLLATAGSLGGAWITFRIGAKIGESGLERHVAAKRLARIRTRIRNSGAITLAALDLIPPPFPFTLFVLSAGALEVDASVFFVTLAICRLFRFGLEAWLASLYGQHILAWLDSETLRTAVMLFVLFAVIVTAASAVRLIPGMRLSSRKARS